MDGWTLTRTSGSPVAPHRPGDQARPVDHHVALAEESRGVPLCCQGPMKVPVCCQGTPKGSPCWCGPDGAGSNVPPGRTATLVDRTCPASGSPAVPLGPGDQVQPVDHHVAVAEEPDGSLAGARNPWVPLLVVALPRGSPCLRPRQSGTRHPVCQDDKTLWIESGCVPVREGCRWWLNAHT